MNRIRRPSKREQPDPPPRSFGMSMRLASFLLIGALATPAIAAEPGRLAPIPKEEAVSTHGPYEMGACETCHQRHDPANPGPALKISNDLCFECHDEFK